MCVQVTATKCRARNAKQRLMSPSATPATQSASGCHQAPRLPRKVKVDVARCHACHAKSGGVTGNQARHQSQPSAISATLATQSAGRCHQVPRQPHKVKVSGVWCVWGSCVCVCLCVCQCKFKCKCMCKCMCKCKLCVCKCKCKLCVCV